MTDVEYRQSLDRWIHAACLMEATAPKPGNVHPKAEFEDVTYRDFVCSADAIAPVLANVGEFGVGKAILYAVKATQHAVGSNTNLGMILLLAPLAAVPAGTSLKTGIGHVLQQMTVEDTRDCYSAIRLTSPGGLGEVDLADVADEPDLGLVAAMSLAARRDRVAAQYVCGFSDVLDQGLSWLTSFYDPDHWEQSIVRLHLKLMASYPDTLIARKCGWEIARESQRGALQVLSAGWPDSSDGHAQMAHFDAWLRADGHRRNPGTTADLVSAVIFAALREGVIAIPPDLAARRPKE